MARQTTKVKAARRRCLIKARQFKVWAEWVGDQLESNLNTDKDGKDLFSYLMRHSTYWSDLAEKSAEDPSVIPPPLIPLRIRKGLHRFY